MKRIKAVDTRPYSGSQRESLETNMQMEASSLTRTSTGIAFHTEAMQQAIACALMVEGRTSPRPPVGAVLVRDGIIVGRGATSPPYGPHAEIQALAEAGMAAHGADLYTTLEPCCITVHTPPCTEALIAAGVRRVIIGMLDPNPLVSGQGVEQLRAAGITVLTQIEQQAVQELMCPFATFITQGRPFVTAKWAMTLDGKIATYTGDSYWISGLQARAWVHDLRDRVDAILVGSGTACIDNPQLTVRSSNMKRAPRQNPMRIVLATHGELPHHLKLFQPDLAARTCVIVGETCPDERSQHLQNLGVNVIVAAVDSSGRIDIPSALQMLAQQGYMHLLIEGGASVLGSAFDQHCIDHIVALIAPKLVGGAMAPSPAGGNGLSSMSQAWSLQYMQTCMLGQDMLVKGKVNYRHSLTNE